MSATTQSEPELTVSQRVAEALYEDLLDRGRSREDAAYVVRQRWHSLGVDEPEEFWAWLQGERL